MMLGEGDVGDREKNLLLSQDRAQTPDVRIGVIKLSLLHDRSAKTVLTIIMRKLHRPLSLCKLCEADCVVATDAEGHGVHCVTPEITYINKF
jgi:hypothetical protein